jgi:hypothetical protein
MASDVFSMKTIKVQLFVEYCMGNPSVGGWVVDGTVVLEFFYDGTMDNYVVGHREARKRLIDQINLSRPSQSSIFLNFCVIKSIEEEVF